MPQSTISDLVASAQKIPKSPQQNKSLLTPASFSVAPSFSALDGMHILRSQPSRLDHELLQQVFSLYSCSSHNLRSSLLRSSSSTKALTPQPFIKFSASSPNPAAPASTAGAHTPPRSPLPTPSSSSTTAPTRTSPSPPKTPTTTSTLPSRPGDTSSSSPPRPGRPRLPAPRHRSRSPASTGDRRQTSTPSTAPPSSLSIKDPKTNVTLWTVTSPVEVAGRSATRARWLNIAVTNLVSRVKVLANQPLSETETADLTSLSPLPRRRLRHRPRSPSSSAPASPPASS